LIRVNKKSFKEVILSLTVNEKNLIRELYSRSAWVSYKVTRKSDKEFDLHIEGTKLWSGGESKFAAWLPLSTIRASKNWCDYADQTDYPEMVEEGDWSGMRDTDNDKIWEIFYEIVKSEYHKDEYGNKIVRLETTV